MGTAAPAAPVLVVGPAEDLSHVCADLQAAGVPAAVVTSGLDALVHYGRCGPAVVVVSSQVGDVAPADLVASLHRTGDALVVAVVDPDDAALAGRAVLAGAGSVLTRPCDAPALLAAVGRAGCDLRPQHRDTYGPIRLDPEAFAVSVAGRRIPDPPAKEFLLLQALVRRAPDLVSDEELRASVWPGAVTTDNTIAVHAARLRHRLEGVAGIRRVRGRGYVLTLQ